MKLLKIFLIIALLLTVVTSVSANKIVFAFVSGNDYMEHSANDKMVFVAGLIDMANVLTKYYNPEKHIKMFEITENMTLSQLTKILDKYLEENPEELHGGAAVSFLYAIEEIIDKK